MTDSVPQPLCERSKLDAKTSDCSLVWTRLLRMNREMDKLMVLQIYDICLREFRHRHAWMGFFDADEFVLLRDRSLKLPTFLKVSGGLCG